MNTRPLSLLPAAALVCTTAAACSDPPERGTVVSTKNNGAHYDEYLSYGAYITTSTTVNGVTTSRTTCSVWLTGQTWVPAAWSLKLRDGKDTGWRDVPESVYNGPCGQVGAAYPTYESGREAAR